MPYSAPPTGRPTGRRQDELRGQRVAVDRMNDLFERLRERYIGLLDWSLEQRAPVLVGFLLIALGSLGLVRIVGRDFFPNVDAGTLRLHARMAPGTRIEQTEVRFADVEQEIRRTLPADELDTILDNIGIPNAWSSLAQGDVPNIAATDGEILISLNRERHELASGRWTPGRHSCRNTIAGANVASSASRALTDP